MTDAPQTNRWRRLDVWDERPLCLDQLAAEDPENGFRAAQSPYDPNPSLTVEGGRVRVMDGRAEADFDLIDAFIARHHLDLAVAEEAMAVPSADFARMLVDINVPRAACVRLAAGMTPAKLAEVMASLNTVELTFAQTKLRARRQPCNQAHVTNAKDDPLQMAADAAVAVRLGFAEIETTVRVARNARLNAIGCQVGAAVAGGDTLVQCSVEEAEELSLGLAGLTSYTETVSVYGTEGTFIDGDDTPWSKAFLIAAYASRGLKARCTSGSGSELLMGIHEKKSLLYLEARCLCLQRGMGVQGTQNGGIDGAPITCTVPGGMWEILAENVLAALLDLECASGNDTILSNSEIRRGAKIMPFLMAGTDLICSGMGAIPRYDNSFNASLFNAEDTEDYLALQRDYLVEGGLRYVPEEELIEARRRAVDAMAAVLEELGVAEVDEAQRRSVVYAHGSDDTATFTLGEVGAMNDALKAKGVTMPDIIRALATRGFEPEAEALTRMTRLRVAGDYLQTAAIVRDGKVVSAVNDRNDYAGPGTGYLMTPERRAEIIAMRRTLTQDEVLVGQSRRSGEERRKIALQPRGPAAKGEGDVEVVIGLSPAFLTKIFRTTGEVSLSDVLRALLDGVRSGGAKARVVRLRHTADTSFLGLTAARLSASGIGIGIQAKGTTVIHKHDLVPHMNLELFSQAPLMTVEAYRALGRNAALYARGQSPEPVVVPYRGQALGARHHAETALLYAIETELCDPAALPEELEVRFLERA
ncbi:MAG: propanediol/glycerol family dehydratase large subunit [Geminicoccaceae bacterium]